MASTIPSSTLSNFTVSKYESVWQGMGTGIGPGIAVNAPTWMSEMYNQLCGAISKAGEALKELRKAEVQPEIQLPNFVRVYEELVREQNVLYNELTQRSTDWLTKTSKEAFSRFEIAANQFSSQIEIAIQFLALKPEERSTSSGSYLLQILEAQAVQGSQQMGRIFNYLGQRESFIRDLLKRMSSEKTELASLKLERDELIKNAHPEAERCRTQELLNLRDTRRAKELKDIWNKLSTLHDTLEKELKGNVSNERRLLLKQLIKEVKSSVRSASTNNVSGETDEPIAALPASELDCEEEVEEIVRSDYGSIAPPEFSFPSIQNPDSEPWDSSSSDESNFGGNARGEGPPRRTPLPSREPWAGRRDAIGPSSGRKKPPINKPKNFGGDRNGTLTYRQWFTVLEDYLDYHQASYENDQDKITIVGSHMEGKARDWFDSRKRQMRDLHVKDNFKSFHEAMDARFKTDKEDHVNLRKMKKVVYNNDVQAYIDALEHLNLKVGLSGLAWRDILKNGLPDEISYRLSLTQGGEPQEDDSLIQSIREHGLAHERRLDEKKLKGDNATSTTPSKSKKRKRDNQDSTETQTPKKPKDSNSAGNAPKPKGPRGKGEPVYAATDKEAAHKGIPQTLIDKRLKEGDCTRCGFDNHRWMYCRKEAVVSSAKKSKKAAAAQKAERNSKEVAKSEPDSADGKVSAVKAGKNPFERKFSVGIPIAESDESRGIMAHLKLKAGISSRHATKSSTETSNLNSRVYEIPSEDEEE
jgi:N-acetylglutamate synthase-like GNAT family acetyltransferase